MYYVFLVMQEAIVLDVYTYLLQDIFLTVAFVLSPTELLRLL